MMEEFHSLSKLEAHLNVIGHYSLAEQVRRGLYFTLRIDWVGHCTNLEVDIHAFLIKCACTYKKV